MPDLRHRKKERINQPIISSFAVERDSGYGYRVNLKWDYENTKIVGFNLYRATYGKNLLNKNFVVSQRALEVISPGKSNRWKNNLLYSKNWFVENSKVTLPGPQASRHAEFEATRTSLKYEKIAFIRSSSAIKNYSFVDNSVKFGKTYSYVLRAITSDSSETPPGAGIRVNIEDLTPPSCAHSIKASEIAIGILLNFDVSHCHDAEKYYIYRRRVGEKNWEFIDDFQNTKAHISFVDASVTPGNEYEYKIYLEDFYGNISWNSPISLVEYQSNFLKKGAIIDPIVKVIYEEPCILISGEINHPRIIGYRIERMDISDREQKFEIKSDKRGIPNPNTFVFDADGKIEHRDFNIDPDKIYKYRISSISLTGKVESIYITPPFKAKEADYERTLLEDQVLEPARILNFDIEVLNEKQIPIYTKISWDIAGDWDYIKIYYNDESVIVDNIHKLIFMDNLKKGNLYNIYAEVYNLLGDKVAETGVYKISI